MKIEGNGFKSKTVIKENSMYRVLQGDILWKSEKVGIKGNHLTQNRRETCLICRACISKEDLWVLKGNEVGE